MARLLGAAITGLAVAVGCAGPPAALDGAATGLTAAQSALTLAGRVEFGGPGRQTATTIGEIAVAATVAFLDVATNTTVTTAKTDQDGSFVLTFTGGFRPDPAKYYIIEAIKGLAGNMPGNDAARVRTIANWNGLNGWQSMTTGGLNINPTTTSLAIMQASYLAARVPGARSDPARYMNLVVGKAPALDLPAPLASGQTTVDPAALLTVLRLVAKAIQFDADPVAAVLYNALTATFGAPALAVAPTIAGLVPAGAARGTDITIYGTRFSANKVLNTVYIGTRAATVLEATESSLKIKVPDDATSGDVKVVTADGESNRLAFTVFPDPGGFLQP
ncbi:MAG: IPT/TIG domain-containing protein [Candidatus Sericytochromatia bacterium]|nr:IPT/TIG domain-containing protein [Candidatus Tanganyikabacteria bacterium]